MKNDKYIPVIGLEVHVELKTKSKMFCSCKAEYFGEKPNTNTCPVCLGLPGALPVPNQKAIEWCVMIGLSLGCKIPLFSKFDRKNYFYPDLPKGYQISQYDEPFAINGSLKLKIKNDPFDKTQAFGSEAQARRGHPEQSRTDEKLKIDEEKIIRIRRVHMEEDTAKLIHQGQDSLIDFNRSGVPLVEIVTQPDFESAQEVVEYLKKLQQIVRYLGVSDADMEKGNMRLEPNISLRINDKELIGKLPNYKVEVKNINSFRFVEKAIEYEIKRQEEILNNGETPAQETMGWNEKKGQTVSQRIKEEANDYRYFPEPDIPPIRFTQDQISKIKSQIGELPEEKLKRFQAGFGLSAYDAEILTREKPMANFFEETIIVGKKHNVNPKQIANFLINRDIDINLTLPAQLIQIILNATQTDQIDEKELEKIIDKVLKENPKAVSDYKSGKQNAIMFLMGQVMKNFKEKIDAEKVRILIMEGLR
ncbi:MAG: Asp-tRNA(Asn)/Glu-tRNA(Gln) amidotransferase subunit GatB [Candidatus Levybacteria bacterium]|nr:Asp-tRNA(Asn)/Glu-tRNA(Gln) amidotransferase subunit GatB [Candidatus Levybacteria bacterium]